MMRLLLILCLFAGIANAQTRTDVRLQKKVETLLQGFRGVAGVYIKDLKTGKAVCILADSVFPTASMIKVPILVGVTDQMAKETCNTIRNWCIKTRFITPEKIFWVRSSTTNPLNYQKC